VYAVAAGFVEQAAAVNTAGCEPDDIRIGHSLFNVASPYELALVVYFDPRADQYVPIVVEELSVLIFVVSPCRGA
jgi:hypothetical protein